MENAENIIRRLLVDGLTPAQIVAHCDTQAAQRSPTFMHVDRARWDIAASVVRLHEKHSISLRPQFGATAPAQVAFRFKPLFS